MASIVTTIFDRL